MKLNRKAQQIIEYLLLITAVVLGALALANKQGPLRHVVEHSLGKAVDTIYKEYAWHLELTGFCDVPCGIGTEPVNYTCVDGGGAVVADSLCEEDEPKPGTSISCDEGDCSIYQWVGLGDWTPCSNPCGTGTTTETILCRANIDGELVDFEDMFCLQTTPKPNPQSSCTGNTGCTCNALTINHANACPGTQTTGLTVNTNWTLPNTCSVGGICEARCNGGYTPSSGACLQNCPLAANGAVATRCSVGAMNHGATLSGGCSQLGTCSATCNNGNLTWNNNCTPFANCSGGTNGPAATRCTVTAVNHGASRTGSCSQLGSCSASCNNGNLTWTNNCTPFLNCPAANNGSGSTRCSVTATNHGANATGSCSELGTCSASCNNGNYTWSNNCQRRKNCGGSTSHDACSGSVLYQDNTTTSQAACVAKCEQFANVECCLYRDDANLCRAHAGPPAGNCDDCDTTSCQ